MAFLTNLIDRLVSKRLLKGKTIELNSRRIFVLPTKAGVAFIALMFIVLMVGINYQNNLAYGLCFTLSAVFFLTIIHTCYNLSGLKVINIGVEPVFAEDNASFRIRLESIKATRKQAIGIMWSDNLKVQGLRGLQCIDVDKLSGVEVLLVKKATRRGYFYPGPVHIQTTFPLGLFITWVKVDLLFSVTVYPKPIKEKILIIGHSGVSEEGINFHGRGVDDFQGLRSYQPGDSMRLVNWKSFSKGQGIFVKDFSALAGKECWLDFEEIEGSIEHRLSVLCFWVLKMEQELKPYGLKLPDYELAPAIGDRQKQQALNALALYRVAK